jgi:flavin-dependent dehydrogenase
VSAPVPWGGVATAARCERAGAADTGVDVVVVGGGPVGLGTAVEARLAGFEVTVIEPRADPVDKACGEGLMPGAVKALARLGVTLSGRPFRGIAYVQGGSRAQALFRNGEGLGVRRTALHAALTARAEELQVRRVTGRVTGVVQDSTGVDVLGPSVALRASWVIAADGLHSPLRRGVGLERTAPAESSPRYGLRRHFAAAPWSEHVEVHWQPNAECYVTPLDDALIGVAVLGTGGETYDLRLDRFPEVRERLGGAAPTSPVRGAGPLRQRAASPRAGRVLLVGDAAGYVDALTGEGVALGLACARELVDCLAREAPGEYDRRWRAVSRRYRLLTEGLLWAGSRPRLRARIVPAAQRLPRTFAAIVEQIAR